MSNPTFLAGGNRIHSSSEGEMTGAPQNLVGTTIKNVGAPKETD